MVILSRSLEMDTDPDHQGTGPSLCTWKHRMKMAHKSDRVLPPFRFWILTYGSDLAGAQLFPKLNCPFCSLTPGSWGCHPEIPDDSLSSSCTWMHILLLQSPSCCGNKPLLKQDKKVFLAERGMINSLLQKSSPFLTGSNHICWQNPTC